MVHESREKGEVTARWRTRMDLTAIVAVSALGFVDLEGAPPGDMQQSNKKTPFVWAEEHY